MDKPVDIKKIKKLIEKSKTLQKVIMQPEQEVAKASLLNANNLYKFLAFLRDIYPIGYSFDGLKEKMNLEIFSEHHLEDLRIDNLIMKRNLNVSEEVKKILKPNFLKMFPEYVITSKGMEFLNSLETHRLNKNIKWLTTILVWFGGITILLMGAQLVFQILQYLHALG